jgi:hypothetical protein
VYEDHVVVEEETVDRCEGKDQKDRQIDTYQSVSLLFVVVIIEPEVIAVAVGTYGVDKDDYVRIEDGHDAIPTDHFVEHSRHAIAQLFGCPSKTCEK